MAEPQSDSGPVGAPPAKAKGFPPLLMAVIALCSVGSLAVSTLALRGSRTPGSASAKHAEPKKAAKHSGERTRFDLGEFLVNLADPDIQAFVKTTIVVEYEGAKKSGGHGEESEEWEPPVRDAIVSALSQCRRADLRSEGGKDGLKKRILKRINGTDDDTAPTFVAVYLTSFAMQ